MRTDARLSEGPSSCWVVSPTRDLVQCTMATVETRKVARCRRILAVVRAVLPTLRTARDSKRRKLHRVFAEVRAALLASSVALTMLFVSLLLVTHLTGGTIVSLPILFLVLMVIGGIAVALSEEGEVASENHGRGNEPAGTQAAVAVMVGLGVAIMLIVIQVVDITLSIAVITGLVAGITVFLVARGR